MNIELEAKIGCHVFQLEYLSSVLTLLIEGLDHESVPQCGATKETIAALSLWGRIGIYKDALRVFQYTLDDIRVSIEEELEGENQEKKRA